MLAAGEGDMRHLGKQIKPTTLLPTDRLASNLPAKCVAFTPCPE